MATVFLLVTRAVLTSVDLLTVLLCWRPKGLSLCTSSLEGSLKGRHQDKVSVWSHTRRQIKSSHFPSTLVMRHQGLFEERGSELVQQGWLSNVYDMSDLTFGRASGWHLSLRQAWPWHFMYHVELLWGKGERGKFTYRHRQMNIAYWSAYETGCSHRAGGLLHCSNDVGRPQ